MGEFGGTTGTTAMFPSHIRGWIFLVLIHMNRDLNRKTSMHWEYFRHVSPNLYDSQMLLTAAQTLLVYKECSATCKTSVCVISRLCFCVLGIPGCSTFHFLHLRPSSKTISPMHYELHKWSACWLVHWFQECMFLCLTMTIFHFSSFLKKCFNYFCYMSRNNDWLTH